MDVIYHEIAPRRSGAALIDRPPAPDRVLVTYCTRYGSTHEVAEFIGHVLGESGVSADVRPMADMPDLSPYAAVVMGCALWSGNIMPEALDFVEAHHEELRRMPVALFTTCSTMSVNTEEKRREVMGHLEPVTLALNLASVGLFGSVVDYRNFSPVTYLLMRLANTPEGDFRDWEAIRTWALGLRAALALGKT
jgi:menaquinone-dependent protoporphyrinogen oxidase